ncbi:MAG: hypothetical protein ACK4VN_16260 [Bacteroidales bacterium]
MRKRALLSALILGGTTAMAGTHSFSGKRFPLELQNGQVIEILLQQEHMEEELPAEILNLQSNLSRQRIEDEKLIQFLNTIRQPEKELDEELPA